MKNSSKAVTRSANAVGCKGRHVLIRYGINTKIKKLLYDLFMEEL